MAHRRDIDGLRAVAVLSVVLHQYREILWSRVSGGFVGVDVFFVISSAARPTPPRALDFRTTSHDS